ncbi:MAG: response regulator transcription factor [Chloroflexota bacterium]
MTQATTDTILVVDDQPDLLESIELTLVSMGYHVLTANDGLDALNLLKNEAVALIVADIAMPRLNGYQLYEQVRENPAWVSIPFLFLTARALDSDVRYGKALGVDDYLTKPIEPEDLLAAVQGKLRRAKQLGFLASTQPAPPITSMPALSSDSPLRVGRLTIDPVRHQVQLAKRPIKLSAREFMLLYYFAERVNQVISPQELATVTHSLETDAVEAGALLRPLIRSLRRKLGYKVGEMGCLENIRGVGYRLITP